MLLLSGILSSCEKKDSSVIDSIGSAPKLSASSLSISTINTDTINIGPTRNPDDVLPISVNAFTIVVSGGVTPVSSVQFIARDEKGSNVLATGTLADDGNPPDSQINDSLYSGKVTFQILRSTVGVFPVELFAQDAAGFRSNSSILSVRIVRLNRAPVLSDLVAPDTVKLSSGDQLLQLRVTAKDSDGVADIRRVSFNSFKPDGSPSSQNPFQMFDDGQTGGTSGDILAGDQIYSLKILLPAITEPGIYRFEFQALDLSNVGSNVIIHQILIVQ